MKRIVTATMKRLLLLLLLLPLLAACAAGDGQDGQAAPGVEGPALVMFYTDN